MGVIWEQFQKNCSWTLSVRCVRLHFKIITTSSGTKRIAVDKHCHRENFADMMIKRSKKVDHWWKYDPLKLQFMRNSYRLITGKQDKSEGFDSCDRPCNLKLDSNRQFFRPCDLEIWRMTLQNNRAHLLCYFKLCASFRTHWWIQTWVTVRKRSIRVKIDDFDRRVTLKFDGWPWKTIGHLFYATSSFVHHFVAIGESKLELQSGYAEFGSNSTIFRAVWP